jgi:hypothetical protein
VSVNPAFSFVSLTTPLRLPSSPPLALTLKLERLIWMESVLSCRFGIQLAKNASGLLQLVKKEFMKAYYRGAMGILLTYDVTDERSFNNIRNWIRNIEQHASEGVNKILIGNKCDMLDKKVFSNSLTKGYFQRTRSSAS